MSRPSGRISEQGLRLRDELAVGEIWPISDVELPCGHGSNLRVPHWSREAMDGMCSCINNMYQ